MLRKHLAAPEFAPVRRQHAP